MTPRLRRRLLAGGDGFADTGVDGYLAVQSKKCDIKHCSCPPLVRNNAGKLPKTFVLTKRKAILRGA